LGIPGRHKERETHIQTQRYTGTHRNPLLRMYYRLMIPIEKEKEIKKTKS